MSGWSMRSQAGAARLVIVDERSKGTYRRRSAVPYGTGGLDGVERLWRALVHECTEEYLVSRRHGVRRYI